MGVGLRCNIDANFKRRKITDQKPYQLDHTPFLVTLHTHLMTNNIMYMLVWLLIAVCILYPCVYIELLIGIFLIKICYFSYLALKLFLEMPI